jgi:hypothetical protein
MSLPGSRTFFQDLLSSFGNMETYVWHRNLRGVFFEPGSARIRGDTEKTSEKFMTSEDVTLLHCCGKDAARISLSLLLV